MFGQPGMAVIGKAIEGEVSESAIMGSFAATPPASVTHGCGNSPCSAEIPMDS
jgi:hypothetical protein